MGGPANAHTRTAMTASDVIIANPWVLPIYFLFVAFILYVVVRVVIRLVRKG